MYCHYRLQGFARENTRQGKFSNPGSESYTEKYTKNFSAFFELYSKVCRNLSLKSLHFGNPDTEFGKQIYCDYCFL
jgi:hypothetical protein